MGVPKFFRYMSERYPCLSEFVKEYQIPEFDNLYLDMNGIIHMCSHPDDNNPHFRITEEKLFSDIFHYIEVLFRMIRPQKVFFMAIDGVAPRAKMNQQRGRRFRSAKDAEKSEQDAIKKGEKLPEGARFDSNCITPGTEFMAKLHEQLKYFVVKKISTDKGWKKCKVILSGHETPGEGEHKIMDYIRYIRAQPGYDPNTRHCLYGLDADLIMLGLCTHDPHFSLLREEVNFGKKSTKRNNVPEQIRFYLLHLSLMREYLELEFAPLKDKLKETALKFDIEKIIDDWILMGFLVGNDFIPNLPDIHIVHGALPILYGIYMEVLPTLDGYINEAGTLNLCRFEKFMHKLAELDFKNFEEKRADLQYMSGKTGRKVRAHAPNVDYKTGKESNDYSEVDSPKPSMDPALAALIQETDDLDIESEDEDESASASSDSEFNSEFKSFKKEYYRNKMDFDKVTREVMQDQAEGYVRAIQWNLNYYYNGVCSWSWYYPHHYSPYISDIKGFSDLKIEFDLGTPFKPFEQLLAVLPTGSKDLLPKCYHDLMCSDNSLIKNYYPEDFQTDLNGKRQEWEAVVLVPFIDENNLLDAMHPCNELLTPEEAKRNSHGPMLIYNYVEDNLGVYEAPNYFPKIAENRAFCATKTYDELRVPTEKLVKGAYPGAKFDVFYPGFPTLKHLQYTSQLKPAKVKVFEQVSKCPNMVLKLLPKPSEDLPEHLLGNVVWVAWPHLVEAKVVAVSNRTKKVSFVEGELPKSKPNSEREFQMELEFVTSYYMTRWGVDFGQTDIIIHVKLMIGRKYICTPQGRVNLEKQFAIPSSNFPYQAVVTNIAVHDTLHTTYTDITDLFPVGSTCFSLSHPYYGSMGTILESAESLKNNQLKVALTVYSEPNLSSCLKLYDQISSNYQKAKTCAMSLSMSPQAFSRVTGTLLMRVPHEDRTVNAGLDLKFNKKNKETPGYTKRICDVWYYTRDCIELVGEYNTRFPEVFVHLSKSRHDDEMQADKVFGLEEWTERVAELKTWLRGLPTHNLERRVCESDVLDAEVVAAIENVVDKNYEGQKPKQLTLQIPPQLLFKPELQFGNLDPDKNVETMIFDRVVNIKDCAVPMGLKGTVIAVHKPATNDENDEEVFDILFDKRFDGGMTLNSSESRAFRLQKLSFINLCHGRRDMETHTGKPGALMAMVKEQQQVGHNFRLNSGGNQFSNGRPQNSAFVKFNKDNQGQGNSSQQQFPVRQQPVRIAQKLQGSVAKKNADFMPSFEGPTKNRKENVGDKEAPVRIYKDVPSTSSGIYQPPVQNDPSIFLKQLLQINNSSSDETSCNSSIQNSKVPVATESFATQLLQFYQARGLGCPNYSFSNSNGGLKFSSRLILPDGNIIWGEPQNSKFDASESVAKVALENLKKNLVPQNYANQLPQKFPVPPPNWVHPNQSNGVSEGQMVTQIFTNKLHQQNQSPVYQVLKPNKPHSPNVHKPQPRKPQNPKKISGQNFVPLQAITKRPVKSGNNAHVGNAPSNIVHYANEKKDRRQPAHENSLKGQQAETSKQRNEIRQKKRPMRIAANFKTDQ